MKAGKGCYERLRRNVEGKVIHCFSHMNLELDSSGVYSQQVEKIDRNDSFYIISLRKGMR